MMEGHHSDVDNLHVAEIRHRMTNGFQMLKSFARRQLSACETEEAEVRVSQVLEQIRTVASLQSALAEADTGNFRGFLDRIESHWKNLGSARNIAVTVTCDETESMPKKTSENAARILLEAVTNCIEHAFPEVYGGALSIDVSCPDNQHFRLRISDDGVGMDGDGEGGQGTDIIRSLAAEIGGRALWNMREGGGTVLNVEFPVNLPSSVTNLNGVHA